MFAFRVTFVVWLRSVVEGCVLLRVGCITGILPVRSGGVLISSTVLAFKPFGVELPSGSCAMGVSVVFTWVD